MERATLAPVPPVEILDESLPQELNAYIESWLALVQYYLRLSSEEFRAREDSVSSFLTSYFSVFSLHTEATSITSQLRNNSELKRWAFLLAHRALSMAHVPTPLLHWTFLANICHGVRKGRILVELLRSVWRTKETEIKRSLDATTRAMIASKVPLMEKSAGLGNFLEHIAPLVQDLPEVGQTLMVGNDFIDELVASFPRAKAPLRDALIVVTHLSLLSLIQPGHTNASLLHDQLYLLKADGEKLGNDSLISAVVSQTSLLTRIEKSSEIRNQARIEELVTALYKYRSQNPRRPGKNSKGKEPAKHAADPRSGAIHMHHMSLISQIQDLFPDLGSGFIAKLLSEYNDDVEQATLHLLEDSLPEYLAAANRKEELPATADQEVHVDFSPAPTPPPERRNIFDGHELDRLDVDTARLHVGKRDRLVDNEEPDKAAILSALAAFDSDDDERDDTYDIEDVGGTVDVSVSEADQVGVVENEAALFRAFKQNPKVFERDAATRRGNERAALKRETGLTDEAIEGWLLVTSRDARKMRRLEVKYSAWSGQQTELRSTAWRQPPAVSGGDDSEEGSNPQGAQRGARGHHRGGPRSSRGGRGGSVTGPSNESDTQQARQRKEASKGSGANHNRRDQRAKKMARGGFAA